MRLTACVIPLLAVSLATAEEPMVKPVPHLDLGRYAGTWYEIARLPNRFQRSCAHSVVVRYTLREDGRVDVLNQCFRPDGSVVSARGVARRAGDELPASQLEVRFAPSFLSFLPMVWADYWVIDLDRDYTHAVVGGPDRKYLWILSRTPTMPDSQYREIVARVARQYDVAGLVRTDQRRLPPERG
jgi:apolipoprotein D and lipocalin family protein